ncbi:MAG: hypothetical protein ACFFD3_04530 [Candidatus Thorarchaeota archaeon]
MKPRVLDNIIGRIILPGQMSVVHGEERFPLTAIAHSVVIGAAMANRNAIYLDSGSNFSPQLGRVLCGTDSNQSLHRIKIGSVFNLTDVEDLVVQSQGIDSIAVIVLDSLTSVLNMSRPPGTKERQRELFRTLEVVRGVVLDTNIHMMLTDHSARNWLTGESRPIGGNVIEHAVDTVIGVSTLSEINEGVKVCVERTPIIPNPGGVIVRLGHRGIRSLKAA